MSVKQVNLPHMHAHTYAHAHMYTHVLMHTHANAFKLTASLSPPAASSSQSLEAMTFTRVTGTLPAAQTYFTGSQ